MTVSAAESIDARQQVASYFAAVGLPPSARLAAMVDAVVAEAEERAQKPVAAGAVAGAQASVRHFVGEVFGDRAELPDPVRIRAFLGEAGRMFPDDVVGARALARHQEAVATAGEMYEHFRDQPFGRGRVPRWLLGLLVPIVLSIAAAVVFGLELASDGLLAIELVWLLLFVFAFLLCSIGLFTACLGFVLGVRRRASSRTPDASSGGVLPRTAVLMPIYHEDPNRCSARWLRCGRRWPESRAAALRILRAQRLARAGEDRSRRNARCAGRDDAATRQFRCTTAADSPTSARSPATWRTSSSAGVIATCTPSCSTPTA